MIFCGGYSACSGGLAPERLDASAELRCIVGVFFSASVLIIVCTAYIVSFSDNVLAGGSLITLTMNTQKCLSPLHSASLSVLSRCF